MCLQRRRGLESAIGYKTCVFEEVEDLKVLLDIRHVSSK